MPPLAARRRAAAKIASRASYGFALPLPSMATPYMRQVAGMNCIQPTAPAEEVLRLRP